MSGGAGRGAATASGLAARAALCVVAYAVVVLGGWALLGFEPSAVAGTDASRAATVTGVVAGIAACGLFLGAFAGSVAPGRYRPGIATGVVVAVGVALFQVVVTAALVGGGGGLDDVFGVVPAFADALLTPLTGVALVAAFGAERGYAVAARRGAGDR